MTLQDWLAHVYGVGVERPRPDLAERALEEHPELARLAPYAAGNLDGIREHPERTGDMPPLCAVTHSSLAKLRPADFETCAKYLITTGADVNATCLNSAFPTSPLSALYGAAGKNRLPALTRILLDAGANPNDNESLYHSVEGHDLAITRMLLDAGAKPAGSNALNHSLDYDHLAATQLLLDRGADPNEGTPALFWAVRRRRSPAHFGALLAAGADPKARFHGLTPFRAALYFGLNEAAAMLGERTGEQATEMERFIAACASGDRATAEAMLRERDYVREIPWSLQRLLADQAGARNHAGVKLMVELGWPIAAKGGDWDASALNLAVFCGDPELTAYLLSKGASWTERHGYGDDVRGTLRFASVNEPVAGGDWLGCAKALTAAGMPRPDRLKYLYTPEIEAYFG